MTTPANPLRSGPAPIRAKLSTNGNNPAELVNLGDAGSAKSYLAIIQARETTFLAQQDFRTFLILAQGFASFEATRLIATVLVDEAGSAGSSTWTAVAELNGNDVVVTVTGEGGVDIAWTAQITEIAP